ncbi:MAG: DUF1761 domain-containing protein [Anaerolineales bacterium]|nr:MAG: DUF1761 domain-containing protein [Anaerolineales bacterium]
MDLNSINWLAVVLCVVASLIIGSTWFSPKVFFPAWMKAIEKTGMSDSNDRNMAPVIRIFGLTIFASLVQAVFMGLIVNLMGGVTLASGALTGFLLWLGFVAPSSLTNKLFADRVKAWYYEAGNHLVTFVIMGAIHGLMG